MTGIITFAPRFNNDFSLVDWFYRKKVKVMLVDQETGILLLFAAALTILSIIALKNSNVR